MFIHTLLTSLTKKMTLFMLYRNMATSSRSKVLIAAEKGDRPFVETRAIDFAAEFSPSLNCEFKV
jgi:hypothetical protein